jgi:hypothetical protein
MPTRQANVEHKVLVTGKFICNGKPRSEMVLVMGVHDSTNDEIVARAVHSVGICSISEFYPRDRFKNLSGTLQSNLTKPPAPVIR